MLTTKIRITNIEKKSLCERSERTTFRNTRRIITKDTKLSSLRSQNYEQSILKMKRGKIPFFSADWVCQVSPSSFDADDALSSRSARLIVRIPPMAPRIYHDGEFLTAEVRISATSPVEMDGNFPVTDRQRRVNRHIYRHAAKCVMNSVLKIFCSFFAG